MPAIAITIGIFAATLLERPRLSAGLIWDGANALGYLAFALTLYLFVDRGAGSRQRIHRRIGYAIALCVLLHISLLWVPDPTIWSYIALDAPVYMWAGWGALVALIAILMFAWAGSRRFWHAQHAGFRRWHWWLSLGLTGVTFWHIAGSGFYADAWEAGLLAALGLGTIAWGQRGGRRIETRPAALLCMGLAPIAFVLVKQLP